MSAKKNSRQSTPSPAPAAPVAPPAAAAATAETALAAPSWIDSPDPRRRLFGRIALVALWIYVAALWLLALDQWFNWGIFGPKVPPVP